MAGVDVAQIFFDQSISRQTAAKLGLVDEISGTTDKEVRNIDYDRGKLIRTAIRVSRVQFVIVN